MRWRIAFLVFPLIFFAVGAGADSLTVDGKAYLGVHVTDLGESYTVRIPDDGRTLVVKKDRTEDVTISDDAEARAEVLKEWRQAQSSTKPHKAPVPVKEIRIRREAPPVMAESVPVEAAPPMRLTQETDHALAPVERENFGRGAGMGGGTGMGMGGMGGGMGMGGMGGGMGMGGMGGGMGMGGGWVGQISNISQMFYLIPPEACGERPNVSGAFTGVSMAGGGGGRGGGRY